MLTHAQNELLTRVTGEAPMGRLLSRWTWLPFAVPTQLKPFEAPLKVRLLGKDYVAWRAPDGRIGFIDQACPHRQVSMALARNEGCVLRCIFHGWAIDVAGHVAEAPTHSPDPEAFAARVKVGHYPTREAGDMVWVWLGEGEAPAFPKLPFTEVPDGHVWTTVTKSACNWLQGVEAGLDSAHIGALHASWIPRLSPKTREGKEPTVKESKLLKAGPPRYEVERAPWGLSAIALRDYEGGATYMRATQYVAPFTSMIPSYPYGDGSFFIATPVDDENHLLFSGYFSQRKPVDENWPRVQQTIGNGRIVKENFAPLSAGREDNYGQSRMLMAQGHYSGFGANLLEEDMVVQVSMGPIVDRTREHLSSSDVAVVQCRMLLLQALANDADGKAPLAPLDSRYLSDEAMPVDAMVPPDSEWRKLLTREPQT